MVVSPQGLRSGVDGDGPAIGHALLVDPLAEVPDEQIASHLEVCDRALKIFLSAFAESGLPLQIGGKPLLLLQKAVHDPLLTHGGLPVLPPAVEVIAVPTPVGEMREPGFGDKTGPFAEKLAVGHPAAAGDERVLLPGVLVRVSGPPIEVCGVFLHGEAVYLVLEQGQEADLINQRMSSSQLRMRAGSSQSMPRMIHSPFSMAIVKPHHPSLYGHNYSTSVLKFLLR